MRIFFILLLLLSAMWAAEPGTPVLSFENGQYIVRIDGTVGITSSSLSGATGTIFTTYTGDWEYHPAGQDGLSGVWDHPAVPEVRYVRVVDFVVTEILWTGYPENSTNPWQLCSPGPGSAPPEYVADDIDVGWTLDNDTGMFSPPGYVSGEG